MKPNTKERYYKIYMLYTLAHATEEQIAKQLDVSRATIARAIKWVVDQRLEIDDKTALVSAKDAIKYRLQELREDLKKTRGDANYNAVIGFQREIRTNEELLLELQSLLVKKIDLTVSEGDRKKLKDKIMKAVLPETEENGK